jgi:hypothetical protein
MGNSASHNPHLSDPSDPHSIPKKKPALVPPVNLYENITSKAAHDLIELEKLYDDWEECLVPPRLRSTAGLKESMNGLVSKDGPSYMIPECIPVE